MIPAMQILDEMILILDEMILEVKNKS